MYLINSEQIQRAVEVLPRGQRIDIRPFDASCLQHTSYYFRLGSRFARRRAPSGQRQDAFYDDFGELSDAKPFLTLGPREYVRVESYEHFLLDARTLGILGGLSDIAKIGLQLVHSPFIDPLFPGDCEVGHLDLGLLNLSEYEASIRYKDKLGKVSFFDVSDTYPVSLIPGSESERKFRERSDR
jgi:deoxycytidine triphosphate deaminase